MMNNIFCIAPTARHQAFHIAHSTRTMQADAPMMTRKEEKRGTAMVTPHSVSASCRPRLPKKMQTPAPMANPIRGFFSCRQ